MAIGNKRTRTGWRIVNPITEEALRILKRSGYVVHEVNWRTGLFLLSYPDAKHILPWIYNGLQVQTEAGLYTDDPTFQNLHPKDAGLA